MHYYFKKRGEIMSNLEKALMQVGYTTKESLIAQCQKASTIKKLLKKS